MVVALAGRAAEELVFGRVTNGAANDLEKVTQVARAMVFEWGMGELATVAHAARRQLRALGGDEAPPRHRAGPPDRPRLRRGAPAARQAPRRRSTASPERCSRRRRSTRDELIEVFAGVDARVALLRHRRRRPRARRRHVRVAFRRHRRQGIHHLGVAVDDLDEAIGRYQRSVGAVLEHREALRRPGGRGGVAAGRRRAGSSSCRRTGPDTPVGRFLERRGPGHAPRRVRGRRRRRRARPSGRRGRAADRRARRAAGLFGLQVAFVHPEATGGVLAELVADGRDADRIRVEIAFDGQPGAVAATCTARDGRRLDRALARRRRRHVLLRRRRRPLHRCVLRRVVYVKRYARESRVGFGSNG